jgi:hypothetical protein
MTFFISRDFVPYKMNSIENIRYVGGLARAGNIAEDDFCRRELSFVSAFSDKIADHLNKDHSFSLVAMVNHYIGVPCSAVTVTSVDHFGMMVRYFWSLFSVLLHIQLRATLPFLGVDTKTKIRLPFIREAHERKEVKDILVSIFCILFLLLWYFFRLRWLKLLNKKSKTKRKALLIL